MRPMRADRKLELEQELVGYFADCVLRPAVLPAYLAELPRPVRENHRLTRVEERCVVGPIGPVVPRAGEPPARELVIAREIEAHRLLQAVELIAMAPNQLGPADERVVDRPLQRPPPERRVDAVEACREAAHVHVVDDARGVVPARVRKPKIDVAVLGDVLVRAKGTDVAHVAAPAGSKQRVLVWPRIAAEQLTCGLEKDPRVRNQPRDRNARVVDAVLAADQVAN